MTNFNGRNILPHVVVLAIIDDGKDNGMSESATILVRSDDKYEPYVTARVWWHNTPEGGTVKEWDHGHYFSNLGCARADFAKRAKLAPA